MLRVIFVALLHHVADELEGSLVLLGVGGLADTDLGLGAIGPGAVNQSAPAGVEVGFRPFGAVALGAGAAVLKVSQHAAVAQDYERLVKPVVKLLGVLENLLSPLDYCIVDVAAQYLHGYGVNKGIRRGSFKGNALGANDPADKNGVAVVVPYERAAAVIKVPELLAGQMIVLEHVPREIGTLKVLGPAGVDIEDAAVHELERRDLLVRELFVDDYDEVAVAVFVKTAHGERALQVRADEV